MTKLFIVKGIAGSYEDRTEWAICACRTEEFAIEVATTLNKAVQQVYIQLENVYENIRERYDYYDLIDTRIEKIDPKYPGSGVGEPHYKIEDVELLEVE